MNSKASKSPAIMTELRRLHALCLSWGISIKVECLPSAVNVYADRLSREHDSTSWTLAASAFKEVDARFGPHTVDWFATDLSAPCGRFYSRDWTPGCSGVQALRHDWVGENGWTNPPFNLLLGLRADPGGPALGSTALVLAGDGGVRGGATSASRGGPVPPRHQAPPCPEAGLGRGRLPVRATRRCYPPALRLDRLIAKHAGRHLGTHLGAQLARALLAAAYTSNTKRNYVAGWERFVTYCKQNGLQALPAHYTTLAAYI